MAAFWQAKLTSEGPAAFNSDHGKKPRLSNTTLSFTGAARIVGCRGTAAQSVFRVGQAVPRHQSAMLPSSL